MSTPVPGATEATVATAARELVTSMVLEPSGLVSPSIYETARLVASAPWLSGHTARLDYLLAGQRADGGWGVPGGYALVPTLSAVEALLSQLPGGDDDVPGRRPVRADLVGAADRGLRALADWLGAGHEVPDTPAVDLIVPALVARLNGHLDRLRHQHQPGLDTWRRAGRFPLPTGMGPERLASIGRLLAAGVPLPQKLLHALEVLGSAACRHPGVSPVAGAVGASPAATAAWLGGPTNNAGDRSVLTYLEDTARRQGGPVPCTTPITVFERAWVLSTLVRAGVPVAVSPKLLAGLGATLGVAGTTTGPGLPTDADTTSVTLYALARLGHPVDPACLAGYDTGDHFCTWQGEDGWSVTTNAHVLEALGWHVANDVRTAVRHRPTVHRLTRWLLDRQQTDGSWSDRWHSSPYYATFCAALALDGYAPDTPSIARSLGRAVDWVVASQHADGSWGRWGGTVEETAYALHVLLGVAREDRPGLRVAVARGLRHLATTDDLMSFSDATAAPPLWHDKDLYHPVRIVRAATLAVWQLAQARSDLVSPALSVPHRLHDGSGMIRSA
ncbi:prenyltransferase/squalene oxidase repeat-containing protein [Micromonospora echinofusca]|uniref:Prenyltransferase n=1 Tax=Micromonospora echinofusca TaxID=47858 RepID=A0ABS3VRR9_MICEH|nr:prenyltransferase/squalene oxidase repeat-containing protein [Micromonospora echinofusca]MBO4207063.1 prenyltransferase [Micromonospora echinofusca]